jgi:hypothetical protein
VLVAPEIMMVELLGVREERLVPLALMVCVLLTVAPDIVMFEDAVALLPVEPSVFMLAAFKFGCGFDCAYDTTHEQVSIKVIVSFFILI